jgi:ABC-type bacteriocin/lantibiotic exporter with double-glycine peptidase domain
LAGFPQARGPLRLDEASSALDAATERDIMDRIRMLAGEVTILAITHRRSFLSTSDNIVDLPRMRCDFGRLEA